MMDNTFQQHLQHFQAHLQQQQLQLQQQQQLQQHPTIVGSPPSSHQQQQQPPPQQQYQQPTKHPPPLVPPLALNPNGPVNYATATSTSNIVFHPPISLSPPLQQPQQQQQQQGNGSHALASNNIHQQQPSSIVGSGGLGNAPLGSGVSSAMPPGSGCGCATSSGAGAGAGTGTGTGTGMGGGVVDPDCGILRAEVASLREENRVLRSLLSEFVAKISLVTTDFGQLARLNCAARDVLLSPVSNNSISSTSNGGNNSNIIVSNGSSSSSIGINNTNANNHHAQGHSQQQQQKQEQQQQYHHKQEQQQHQQMIALQQQLMHLHAQQQIQQSQQAATVSSGGLDDEAGVFFANSSMQHLQIAQQQQQIQSQQPSQQKQLLSPHSPHGILTQPQQPQLLMCLSPPPTAPSPPLQLNMNSLHTQQPASSDQHQHLQAEELVAHYPQLHPPKTPSPDNLCCSMNGGHASKHSGDHSPVAVTPTASPPLKQQTEQLNDVDSETKSDTLDMQSVTHCIPDENSSGRSKSTEEADSDNEAPEFLEPTE